LLLFAIILIRNQAITQRFIIRKCLRYSSFFLCVTYHRSPINPSFCKICVQSDRLSN